MSESREIGAGQIAKLVQKLTALGIGTERVVHREEKAFHAHDLLRTVKGRTREKAARREVRLGEERL